MTLEELKALLAKGAITQAQFEAMCKQFGYELDDNTDDDGAGDDDTDGEGDDSDGKDDADKLLDKKIQQAVDRATNRLGNDNKKLREQLEKLKKEKLTAEELQKLEAEEKEKDLANRAATEYNSTTKMEEVQYERITAENSPHGAETCPVYRRRIQ